MKLLDFLKKQRTAPKKEDVVPLHVEAEVASNAKAALVPTAGETLRLLGIETIYITRVEDLPLSFLQSPPSRLLGLDIETITLYPEDKQSGLDPRKSSIRLVQLYDGATTVYVFDILKLGELAVLGSIIWDRPMVAHAAKFEFKHLLHAGVHPQKLGCTYLADRILNGTREDLRKDLGLSKSADLKALSRELLGIEISKDGQTSNWGQPELEQWQIDYAALDAVLVVKLFDMQWQQLEKGGLQRSYHLNRGSQYPIVMAELCGIELDVEEHRKLLEEWKAEKEELYPLILDSLGVEEINLNSNPQLGAWLRGALSPEALSKWPRTDSGGLSTDKAAFERNIHVHSAFQLILDYKYVSTRISCFGETLYQYFDPDSGRIHGTFNLCGAATGRMSASAPNLQQIPREDCRRLFRAKEGYLLVGLDFSQQELRVCSQLSQDPVFLSVYADNGDAHTETAAAILSLPKDKVTKHDRQIAKSVNFGLLYGQGAAGLVAYARNTYRVEMTIEEAERFKAAFFKTYARLHAWQKEIGNEARVTGKLRTPCGFTRNFTREARGYRYNAALNLPVQGGACEVTLHSLLRLAPLLDNACRLVAVVHDEVVLEVIEHRAEELASKAEECMRLGFLDVFPDAGAYLQGAIDWKIGKTWADTK